MKINNLDVKGKKVLVRVDFNVPIIDGVITDDNRIVQALPTIKLLVEKGSKVILFSHLGKVKTGEDKKSKSLRIVAEKLEQLIGMKIIFSPVTRGSQLTNAINEMQEGQILMVENTRFEDLNNKAESNNDPELAKYWASLGDGIFINDAFGTAHRAHASNVGIAKNSKLALAGLLLEKEIEFIGGAVDNPKLPLVAILGGSKVSDKILVFENLIKKADYILVGGGMMFTFLKAEGVEVGNSLVEETQLDLARHLIKKAKGKIILPIDTVAAKEFKNDTDFSNRDINAIPKDYMGLDIGEKSIKLFEHYVEQAETIIWNGPMGVFEFDNFKNGTVAVCEMITKTEAISIIGGGDSAAAAIQFGFKDSFTHISTGGGSSLEYLEGKKLPGIECLTK